MRKKASKSTVKTKAKKAKLTRPKKSIIKRAVSKAAKAAKAVTARKKKTPARPKAKMTAPKLKETVTKVSPVVLQQEKQAVEETKFTATDRVAVQETGPESMHYNLPVRYGDDRIMLLPRDPWWMHTYWDISENRINEVINSIPVYEREGLRWVLRIYDVTSVRDFQGNNANMFFDIDINFEANNWYINIGEPEREWCVEIGFKNHMGNFYLVARSNIVKTPYFGVSSIVDEEWALPDDEYFKMLGTVYDFGSSSLEKQRKLEQLVESQISSPLASWGISSFSGQKPRKKDDFFLEVWTELILYGRTRADAEVKVEGKKVQLRGDGTFTLRYALPPGDFKFEVKATSKNKKHKRKAIPAVKRYNK